MYREAAPFPASSAKRVAPGARIACVHVASRVRSHVAQRGEDTLRPVSEPQTIMKRLPPDPGLSCALHAAAAGIWPTPAPRSIAQRLRLALGNLIAALCDPERAADRQLRSAAMRGDVNAVRRALRRGADPTAVSDRERYNAFHAAAWSGNADVMQVLVAAVPRRSPALNAPAATAGHPTPLIIAAALQHGQAARALIARGASVEAATVPNPQAIDEFYKESRTAEGAAAHVLTRLGLAPATLRDMAIEPGHILNVVGRSSVQ